MCVCLHLPLPLPPAMCACHVLPLRRSLPAGLAMAGRDPSLAAPKPTPSLPLSLPPSLPPRPQQDFPYHLQPGVAHLNLWANRPLTAEEVQEHIAARVGGPGLLVLLQPPLPPFAASAVAAAAAAAGQYRARRGGVLPSRVLPGHQTPAAPHAEHHR